MSKRILKTIILAIILSLSIIGIQTEVSAKHIGWGSQTITGSWVATGVGADVVEGRVGDETFCIQQGYNLMGRNTFTIPYYVHIDGTTSSIYRGNSNSPNDLLANHSNVENAILSWILLQGDTGYNAGLSAPACYSSKQMAVYGMIGRWFTANGGIDYYTNGYTNNDWIMKGSEYAKTLQMSNNLSMEKRNTEPVVETTMVGNEEYIKVGPYQAAFTGNVDYVNVYDQDGNQITPMFGSYEGTELKVSQNASEIVKSDKEFFLLLSEDGKTEEISKIKFGTYVNVQNIQADMWILTAGRKQNLITTAAADTYEKKTTEIE